MKKKKLLIFFPKINFGGIEKNFYWLVSKLISRNKHQLDIISLEYPSNKIFSNKNIRMIKLKKKIKRFKENDFLANLNIFFLLIKFFYKNKKNYSYIISFKSHILILLMVFFFKLKVIIRISNYYGYNKYENKFYKFIINLLKFNIYKSFSYKIVSPSQELSIELKKKYNLYNVWIPNPIEDYLIKKSNQKIIKKKNIFWNLLSVGRLTLQKNHELTILAISRLVKYHNITNLRLKIVGDGDLKIKLLKMIKSLKLEKYVKIMGNLNPHNLLKKSDIYISSSLYEGMPNSLLEMICYKKVIISTKCKTGPKEVLKNGKYGILIEQNNLLELTSAILKVMKNYDKYQKNFEIDQQHLKKFNSNYIFQKYKKLLK